jgi:hypothetical protein
MNERQLSFPSQTFPKFDPFENAGLTLLPE